MNTCTSLLIHRLRVVAMASSVGVLAACGGGSEPASQAGQDSSRLKPLSVPIAASPPAIGVVELVKVSERRVSRTVFDYVFQIRIRNNSQSGYRNVSLTVISVGQGSSVIDGSVIVANIAPRAVVLLSDSVTIRHDRAQPFDPAQLGWQIEGTLEVSPQERIAALEAAGLIPKLERGNTLSGVDIDGNGVRDDIDLIIRTKYPEAPQRAAAIQAAASLQSALLVDVGDLSATTAVADRITRAVQCIFERFPEALGSPKPARVVSELESITTNTRARLVAYLQFNAALNGTVTSLSAGGTCE
jgi:hypothetical protein